MAQTTSPSRARTVLGEMPQTSFIVSPNKRKFDSIDACSLDSPKAHTKARKLSEKENMGPVTGPADLHLCSPVTQGPRASQETLADNPESQDTIPDPDLPSSSSDRQPAAQLKTPPGSEVREDGRTVTRDNAGSTQTIASNLKCRLKLAMYKLSCHKEELNYKKLLPRPARPLTVGTLPTPATQPPQRPQPRNLSTQLSTPKPITSNISNERTLPRLMQRSSSGDASISETPIRRNYKMGLSSPPDSREQLPQYLDVRLPGIQRSEEANKTKHYRLPSISALGSYTNPGSEVGNTA
ncbi:protein of unknown function [Taphrina deformans PYCC 5710]|uniref:Uncharacterized protein n=1 Tax=Taphrina deformans (strain PYCC 5710 / ATCC 11124 / CBS 356.35 / IMI 108563 / JCM 9778 / NBRC 8474) TaxID=1097556 RepID=R4XE54_TAPDE|nr:protein of unknown function [Taphrina deformans PYCC 5710]|eukprot:CCG83947.1 protein of unknown function [Taphrina deformans PYCC 5710]